MNLIDTHCHLFAEEFDADRSEVIDRAITAGVSAFLLPNIDVESISELSAVVEKYPGTCFPMMGLHPTSVKDDWENQLETIENELQVQGKYFGVGEIGLDYYWDVTHKEAQKTVFRRQLQLAKKLHLPVAIHTRNSFEDAIGIVKEELDGKLTGVFHCFTGTIEQAEEAITAGFYLGIGGVVTYKNGGLDKVLPDVPMSAIVLETDSPYLAPVPYRGKRNESSYLTYVLKRLSEIKEIPDTELAEITTANARKLFRLP